MYGLIYINILNKFLLIYFNKLINILYINEFFITKIFFLILTFYYFLLIYNIPETDERCANTRFFLLLFIYMYYFMILQVNVTDVSIGKMADDERQIRIAAEAILSGSINSQRSSVTQHSITRTPDIVLSEDLIAGARHNGRMSHVRRSFCLFVTFDLLLTSLMWLICTMVRRADI